MEGQLSPRTLLEKLSKYFVTSAKYSRHACTFEYGRTSTWFPDHIFNPPGLEIPFSSSKAPSGIDGRLCKLFGTAERASNGHEVFALSLFGQQYPRTCTFLSSARLRCAIADTHAQDLTLAPSPAQVVLARPESTLWTSSRLPRLTSYGSA